MKLVDTQQFKQGKDVEVWLDTYFRGRGFEIRALSIDEERRQCLGDRHFSKGEHSFNVEYKSGIQTAITGNVFLETISVDTANKPGWVYTCRAEYLMYACLLNRKILVFKPDELRARIDELKKKFKTVATSNGQNQGYKTWGVIVPLEYAENELAYKVIDL